MQKALFAFIVLATALSLQSPAFAESPACVPSKTVEAAQADYNAGLAAISSTLTQSYSQAAVEYDKVNAAALIQHQNQIAAIEATYQHEMKEIRKTLGLGWQQAMNAASEKHNQGMREAGQQYAAETQNNLKNYNQRTADAQAAFNTSATQLAAEYNKAVCAAQ